MNVSPQIWGPPAWKFIDAVLESYPDNPGLHDQNWMTDFLIGIAEALPCESCRDNYSIYMSQKPLEGFIGSRSAVKLWLSNYRAWAKDR